MIHFNFFSMGNFLIILFIIPETVMVEVEQSFTIDGKLYRFIISRDDDDYDVRMCAIE